MRYFLDKDDSGHNYLLPENLRESWVEWNNKDLYDDYDLQDEFSDLFEKYMLGYSPTALTFQNPELNGVPISYE